MKRYTGLVLAAGLLWVRLPFATDSDVDKALNCVPHRIAVESKLIGPDARPNQEALPFELHLEINQQIMNNLFVCFNDEPAVLDKLNEAQQKLQ